MPERRHRAAIGMVAVAVAGCAFLVGSAPRPTDASWTTTATDQVTVGAVTPAAVPTVACGASSGLLAVAIPISWTAPAGPTPSRYRVVWSGTAGSGEASFTSSPGSIGGGLLSVAGSSTVTVYPVYGDWVTAPVSLQSRTVTTISALGVVVSWTCT